MADAIDTTQLLISFLVTTFQLMVAMQYNTAQYKLEILTCVFHFIQSQGLTPSSYY